MSDEIDPSIEHRLRAHFADRAARDPLPTGGEPPQGRSTRTWPRLAAAAAAVALVAGAFAVVLSDDEPTETVDVISSSSTTTTGAPTTTTTSEVTTTSPSAASTRSLIVAVEGVLGWWDGTGFIPWTPGARVPASGGERYDVIGIGVAPRTTAGGAPETGCQISEPPGVTIDVGIAYPDDLGPPPIAVTGVAQVLPRPVTELQAAPTHVDVAAEALTTLGVDDDAPALAQVVGVDLEGDGVDELLVVAERVADRETLLASPGDYSVLLLRQIVGGEAVTTIVAASTVPEDTPPGEGFLNLYRISAIADLNGDGTMELVTRGVYYEGSGTAAHRVRLEGGVEQLFAVGCGA